MFELKRGHFQDGPAVAAIFSVALGIFTLGFSTILATASSAVKEFLDWYPPVGSLSGKTGIGIFVWLTTWFLFHWAWKKKEIKFSKVWKLSLFLIFLGFLFTFPPFFEMFATK